MTKNSSGMIVFFFSSWSSIGFKDFDLCFYRQKIEINISSRIIYKYFYFIIKVWFWDMAYLSGTSKTVIYNHNKVTNSQEKAGAHIAIWRLSRVPVWPFQENGSWIEETILPWLLLSCRNDLLKFYKWCLSKMVIKSPHLPTKLGFCLLS